MRRSLAIRTEHHCRGRRQGTPRRVPRPCILGVEFDFTDYAGAVAAIRLWRDAGQREYMTITNPHSVLLCRRDEQMRQATAVAGMTLPDGVGVIWAARILGYRHQGRVTGPTLVLKLCDWGRQDGLRHFFFGGKEGVPEKLVERLSEMFPGLTIAGTSCPPFRPLTADEDDGIVRQINATRPDIVWVGLGAPKQEKWMAAHLGRIEATAMIGVGAAFDFHAGTARWAPAWVRRAGLEWAYRLACDPRRMWRRNLDSPLFLMQVLAQRMGFGGRRRKA